MLPPSDFQVDINRSNMFHMSLANVDTENVQGHKTTGRQRNQRSFGCSHARTIEQIVEDEKKIWMAHCVFEHQIKRSKARIDKRASKLGLLERRAESLEAKRAQAVVVNTEESEI